MTHPLDPLTFPLQGARLIEAGAGTGKTYTIAALYLRLVLGHGGENSYGRALTPPEILVVTFTNAATEELRDRIRKRLIQAAAVFRNREAGDDYLNALRNEFAVDTRPAQARVLDQAAQWMDEAAIYTIHSWSQRMLRRHAFDSGSLFDLTLEPDDKDLLEEAACDYWRSTFYPQPAKPLAELLELIQCSTPQELLKKVRPLLNVPSDAADDPFIVLKQRRQAIEDARQKWAVDLEVAVEQLRKAHADKTLNGNKYRIKSLNKWLNQLISWVKENGPLPDEKAREKLSRPGLTAGLSKNKTLPEHPAYEAFEQLNGELENLKVDTALFSHAAGDIARRFDQEKQRRSRMGYDDLLTRLNDALQAPGNERLAQVIRQQFPVALIDEFQDTDPVQYAAFSKIYLDRPNIGLFMIGDPKQAIYAFRGADIHTYLNARRETAGRHYTLGRNYRSTEGMVQAVNRMFKKAAEYPEGAFLFKNQIPFNPVAVQGQKARFMVNGEPAKAMHFWQMPQSGPVSKTGAEGYLSRMANAFAGEIVRLLNLAELQPPRAGFEEPDGTLTALRPADIAILVRDFSEARAIRRALENRRIRSVYLSDKDSVFDSDEARQTLYLLRACSEPRQQGFVRAALATPILDLPLTRLDQLNQDETVWEAEVERFCRYQGIWQHQGVLPMFRTLLHEFGVPARLLAGTGGERSLTNLLHLAELLQTEAGALDGEAALVRLLAERLQKNGGSSDEHILRLESDEALVRVITIHKSKGLEYPLVFLPFICSYRQVTARNSSVVKYHDEQGRLRLVQHPADHDLEAADTERLAEDLRLLYVAVTRAQFACRLGIGVMGRMSRNGETSNLHLSGFGYLLSAREMIPTAMVSEKLAQLKGDCDDIVIEPLPDAHDDEYVSLTKADRLGPAREFSGHVPSDWWISSYSGILSGAGRQAAARTENNTEKFLPDVPNSAVEDQLQEVEIEWHAPPKIRSPHRSIHQFPRGPEPGTFLHGLLEWAADKGFDTVADNRELVSDHLQQLCKRRGWEPWAEMLTSWLQGLLKTPFLLPEDQGQVSLANLEACSYQSELEFLFAAHQVDTRVLDAAVTACIMPGNDRPQLRPVNVNGMLKGFIDLTFCHQRRYYVMDYKSNYLGEDERAYGADAMACAMREHRYDLQYVLYTLALHRQLKARLPDYDYQRDMGGAVYLFLRGVTSDGQGIYVDSPPWPLIERLDDYFAGRENDHAV